MSQCVVDHRMPTWSLVHCNGSIGLGSAKIMIPPLHGKHRLQLMCIESSPGWHLRLLSYACLPGPAARIYASVSPCP